MASRTKVYVKPSSRSNFLYGFSTSLDTGDQSVLGQIVVSTGTSGVVFGANSPKPARMRKTRDTGRSNSSYVDAGSRSTASTAGWRLVKRARARGAGGRLSKTVYVKMAIGGLNVQYAWNMPLELYNALASERAALGIKDVSSTEDRFDLVFGCNPKPPRAYKQSGDRIMSTFVDPDASLPAGWGIVGGEEE
ncbi:MAG: hypothetical protein HC769_36445 [Cyanobacteria bacterium CRU_2_1]|nr:hypothetical protein [Cyanobacteria bacterium CRU_2_1]